VEPLKIETELSTPSARTLPSLFFSRTTPFQAVTLASPSLKVNVKKLGSTVPSSYTGVSGTLQLESTVDRTSVEVGEPIKVTITFRGSGKIATIAEPKLEVPSLIERYGPEVDYSINRGGTTINGWKKFEYTLIPRSGGKHEIPAVEFSYFNTASGVFRTLKSDKINLDIKGAKLSEEEILAAGQFPGNDIADIIPVSSTWIQSQENSFHTKPLFLAALLLPLLLLGLTFGFKRYSSYSAANAGQIRSRKAQPVATRQLKKARAELKAGRWKEFYGELRKSVLQFISDRTGKNVSGLSTIEIVQFLKSKGTKETLTKEFETLMTECDQATYSPIKPAKDKLETAEKRAGLVISELHQVL